MLLEDLAGFFKASEDFEEISAPISQIQLLNSEFRGLKRALEASEGFRGFRGLLEALEGFCKASEDFEENFGGLQRAPGGFGRIFRCFGGIQEALVGLRGLHRALEGFRGFRIQKA